MDTSLLAAGEAYQLMEEFYPQFLSEMGYQDTYLSRVAFYGAMIVTVDELPLPDSRAQTLLMDRLKLQYRETQARLQEELFRHLHDRR